MAEHFNYPGGAEGPILTDQNGDLDTPVTMCQWGEHRCKHLGWHDFHYPYCSAQPSPNNDGKKGYAYPWPHAGTHITRNEPNQDCPYLAGVLALAAEREAS